MKFQKLLEKFLSISFEIRFLYLPLSAVGTALEQSDSQFRFRFNGSYCNTLEQVSTFKTDEHYSTRLLFSPTCWMVSYHYVGLPAMQFCPEIPQLPHRNLLLEMEPFWIDQNYIRPHGRIVLGLRVLGETSLGQFAVKSWMGPRGRTLLRKSKECP